MYFSNCLSFSSMRNFIFISINANITDFNSSSFCSVFHLSLQGGKRDKHFLHFETFSENELRCPNESFKIFRHILYMQLSCTLTSWKILQSVPKTCLQKHHGPLQKSEIFCGPSKFFLSQLWSFYCEIFLLVSLTALFETPESYCRKCRMWCIYLEYLGFVMRFFFPFLIFKGNVKFTIIYIL